MIVAEAWDTILSEGRQEPGWHARRVYAGSACDIRSAVRAPDSALAVLFEVGAKSIPPGADFSNCIGFELSPETIEPSPSGRIRLCLVLKDKRYRDLFGALADDVAGAVASAATESIGVKQLLGRLHTWERFVSRFGPGWLSNEQQVGLFAELVFLTTEVIPALAAASAVRAWRGPYREAHDYHFRAAAVEVKATTVRNPTSFQVSNLDQLDPATLETLLIYHVTIEVDSPTGNTLPEMVEQVRRALGTTDPAAVNDFDSSLMEVGYLDAHIEFYGRRFRVAEVRWLHVAGGFPCLTSVSVPIGIASASYSVSLETCMPYTVDAAMARTMLRKGF